LQFPENTAVSLNPCDIPFGPGAKVHCARRLTDERDDAFNAVFIEKSASRRADKAAARAKRKPRKIDPDDILAGAYRNKHRQTSRLIGQRLGEGLLTAREGSASLRRVLQILPKRVLCGSDKKVVRRERHKLFAMDRSHVTLDKRRLGAIPIDLDRTFKSEYDLKERLEKILPADLTPNLAVGTILPSTSLVRPHLIFLLPPGYEVWENNPQAVEFWRSILGGSSGPCSRSAPISGSSPTPTSSNARCRTNGTPSSCRSAGTPWRTSTGRSPRTFRKANSAGKRPNRQACSTPRRAAVIGTRSGG
jgi:hypothetical protein